VLILFWQFTIKTLDELDIVSSQHLSIEMFLIRLMHLSGLKQKSEINKDQNLTENKTSLKENDDVEIRASTQTLDQIKNITQEKKAKPLLNDDAKGIERLEINSFKNLLEVCNLKKEIKLKYELEKNVNLVKFDNSRIEISFNDNLDKDFVKDLSTKLFEWTNKRWIITFSKSKGQMSVKEKEKNLKKELIDKAKQSDLYKKVIEKFPDAELVDIKFNNKEEEND
jgi:DNA polymerase-3 subunit gamma/tau